MLSAGELADMRGTAEAALPDTCTITRKITQSDGGGGQEVAWTTIGQSACRIDPLAGGEPSTARGASTVGERPISESTHNITLPARAEVSEADRVLVDGTVYEVILVRRRGAWELTRRVEAKEAP